MHRFVWLPVFLILAILPAQVSAQDNNQELDPVQIFENFKDSSVDVLTFITLENGLKTGWRGSGFFLPGSEGYLLTNCHVVKDDDGFVEVDRLFFVEKYKIVGYEYYVEMASKGRKWKAELVGPDPYKDFALLKVLDIDPSEYKPAVLGNSDEVKVGQKVYAIGGPHGDSNTLTHGKVSALHRYWENAEQMWRIQDFIQTDSPINPGNSGGALLDYRGRVIGVTAAKRPYSDGMGYAIPINFFNFEQLKKGAVEMPWFGAEAMVLNPRRMGKENDPKAQDIFEFWQKTRIEDIDSLELLAKLTYPTGKDTDCWAVVSYVDEVEVGEKYSPAKVAGLKRGDLIKKLDGKTVRNGMDIRLLLLGMQVGKEFEVDLIRIEKGVPKNMTLKVKLDKKPAN